MDSPVDRGKATAPAVVFVAGQAGSGAAAIAQALRVWLFLNLAETRTSHPAARARSRQRKCRLPQRRACMKVQCRLDGKSGCLLYWEPHTGAPTGVKPQDAGA